MTPLFPNVNEPLILKQGPADDCYLLASLDCVFNSDDECLQLLKSKFVRTRDGVTLRIKRTNQSAYLRPEKINGKYTYFHDRLTDEDVFILSEKTLKEIDDAQGGVQTNSLAIKILERISSYYYVEEWNPADDMASVDAHSIQLRHSETSTVFVGKLIGIQADDREDFNEIIKLKLMNPQVPIYISMAYGEPDVMGKIHERHSLRIDSIVPKPHGDYEVSLVNSWDNQKRERYSLNELKKRDCRFCIFSANPQKHKLIRTLLNNPVEQGKYIFDHPELLNMLFKMQSLNLCDSEVIFSCISLHQQMSSLLSLYNILLPAEQVKLIQCLIEADGDRQKFVTLLITKVPQKDLVKIILQEETLQDEIIKVIVDMALEAKEKRTPASPIFNTPSFFNLVMDAVIYQRSKKRGCNRENVQQKIESEIINYYFDNHKINTLTRYAGLQDFFIANIFSNASIENRYTPRFLLAYAVGKFISTKNFSLGMIKHIQSSDTSLVNETFMNEVLLNCSCDNARELFVGLYTLNQLNPQLAQGLLPLAVKKMKLFFNVSMEQLATEVATEKSSEFKLWFMSLTNSKVEQIKPVESLGLHSLLIQKAKRVVWAYVEQIRNFPVVFDRVLDPKNIEFRCANLILKLENKIRKNSDLGEATEILGFISQHPEVRAALLDKKRIIQETAAQQINQKKAEKVIANIVDQINLFPFSFSNTPTTKSVALKRSSLIHQLENIVKEKDLSEAQLTLGYSEQHPEITDALNDKKTTIRLEARMMESAIISRNEAFKTIQYIKFPTYLANIHKLVENLESQAKNNKNYQKTAEKGRTFYNALASAQYIFLNSGKPKEKNTAKFKKNCLNAIEMASTGLLEHHGWMQAIGDINKALSSIITLASVSGATGRCGLFAQPINAKATHKLPLKLPLITLGPMVSA